MKSEETELVVAIAQGSRQAMSRFYKAFESTVYRFVLMRIGDSAEAAEILNDVMLDVWRGAERFQGRSAIRTWVLGIAHHKVIDRLRAKQRRPESTEYEDTIADESLGAEQAMVALGDASLVKHCLEKLSDAHRQVVQLSFFEDLAYREIAEILDCPDGTVKTRMFHAKSALKRCLSGLGFGD